MIGVPWACRRAHPEAVSSRVTRGRSSLVQTAFSISMRVALMRRGGAFPTPWGLGEKRVGATAPGSPERRGLEKNLKKMRAPRTRTDAPHNMLFVVGVC